MVAQVGEGAGNPLLIMEIQMSFLIKEKLP